MTKILFLFLIIVFSLKADTISIGLYGLDKKVANEKTVKKLMEKFLSHIKGLEKLDVIVNTYYDEATLKEDYKNNKIDLFYMTPSMYIKNFDFFNNNTKNFIILKDSDDRYIQYLSLVNRLSNIDSYDKLENKNVSFYTNHNLSKLWFMKRYYEETNEKNINYNIKDYSNFNQHKKILDVYFNKLDLAVVPAHVWQIAKDLNPKIEERIKILDTSKKIFPTVLGLFNKDCDDFKVNIHSKFISDPKNKETIKKILSLVRYETVEQIDSKVYVEAHEFYEKYEKYLSE